ncbi:MAG: VOC family protein [Phycisphaerales bacterium]|nr:VOC family protein [Phycisphaerales bacterium]
MPKLLECNPMLRTTDMRATIRFYTELLGFRLHSAWPEHEPCWCDLARDTISVMFYTQDPHDTGPTAMTGRLYFRTDDVMTIYNSVKDKAEVFEGPEVHFYGMKEIAIRDPNGYTLVFAQPTDEPPTCKPE